MGVARNNFDLFWCYLILMYAKIQFLNVRGGEAPPRGAPRGRVGERGEGKGEKEEGRVKRV